MREWNRRSREVKGGGSGLRLDEAEARRCAEQVITGLAEWIETDIAAGKASLNTRRAYQLDGRQLFEWLVLEQICPDEVGREEAGRYRNSLAEKYLPSTIARKIVSARLFFDMAQARGGVTRNPFLEPQCAARHCGAL